MVTSATSRDANQEPQGCDLDFAEVSSLASDVEQVDSSTAKLSMGDIATNYSHSFAYFSRHYQYHLQRYDHVSEI